MLYLYQKIVDSSDQWEYTTSWSQNNEKWDLITYFINIMHIPTLISIAAMNLKLGRTVLQSSRYSRYESCVMPISGVGVASERVGSVRKSRIMPHFGGSLLGTGGLL